MKWSAVERFSVQGIYFIIGIIMARKLTPSDYGTVGVIGIFLAVSQTFIDSGFSSALIRKQDRTEKDFSTVFYFNILAAIIFYGLLFILAPYIADFFKNPIVCNILRIQSLTLIISSLYAIHATKLTINLDFKALAKRSLLASILSGILGIICAYCGLGVWSLVVQNLTNVIVNAIFFWIYVKWHPLLLFSKKSFNELFSFGGKLLLSSLINTLYNNINTLVIGKFFSAKDLGVYERGTHIARIPVDTTNNIVGKVTYPILSKLQNDETKMISVYRKYINILSMIIFFGCCLMAAISKPLILILLTDKWEESIIYLQIFSFSIMFDHINVINLNILMVKGRSDLFLRLEIIKKTISITILFLSIPFGVIGICASKILYTQIAIFINTYYTGKLFNLGYLTQLKDYSGFFFLSVVSCLPAFMFCQYVSISYFISLPLACLVSAALYLIILKNNSYMREAVQLLTTRLKRNNHSQS